MDNYLKNLKIIGCNKDIPCKNALCLTDSASFTLINCTFQDNVALCGGAIDVMKNAKLDIKGVHLLITLRFMEGLLILKVNALFPILFF